MRVGVISDVHANKVAFEAVLEHMPAVDAVISAGDVVGYNPWPAECVDVHRGDPGSLDIDVEVIPAPLQNGPIPTVMGNHDRMVISNRNFLGNDMAVAGVTHARSQLDAAQLDWLRSLPAERTVLDECVKIVHGHPDDPDRYTYPREFHADLLGDEHVLVMGHTHVQAHEVYDEGIVMNPGSVGQPRDGDPRSAYAILDLDRMAVEERRVPYDIEAVQEAVGAAGLPRRTGRRLEDGR